MVGNTADIGGRMDRIETDSLGEVRVPEKALWGAQTQRALELFTIDGELMPREMIRAYAILKKGCARANGAAGKLDDGRRDLIHLCSRCNAYEGYDFSRFEVDGGAQR